MTQSVPHTASRILFPQETLFHKKLHEIILYFLELGTGWEPAVLNTEEEHEFIREGQKSFASSVPYWIGGSTNQPNDTFNYSEYITNSSGTILHN